MKIFGNIFDIFKVNSIPVNITILKNYILEEIVINPKYELLTDQQGLLKLRPVGDKYNFYRGQIEEFNPCLSSIDRIHSEFDIKLSRLKSLELEHFYKHTSLYVEQQSLIIHTFGKNYQYQIDYLSLAQHYNIPTEYLDLTNNLLIAAFFATNKYDSASDSFIPIKKGKGIIYKYMDASEFRVTIVGFQPFLRPGEQKAFAIRLEQKEDFSKIPSVQRIVFNHSHECSEFLNELFDKGKILFPPDPIAKIANAINTTNIFSINSLHRLHERYFPNISLIELKDYFEKRGISFADILPSLTTDETRIVVAYWEKSKKYLLNSPTRRVLYAN